MAQSIAFLAALTGAVVAATEAGIIYRNNNYYSGGYMPIDIRQLAWPEATLNTDPSKNFSLVDCYTELDRSFVGNEVHLSARKQLSTRSCMLRIPTRTRVQLKPLGAKWANGSYVWIIAGASITHMPLRTKKIYGDEPVGGSSQWGPWHVPCSHAYIVFHAENPANETLAMRFAEEHWDAFDPRQSQCDADGRNYAMADI